MVFPSAPPPFANNKDLLSNFPDIIYFPLEDGQRCADVLREEKIEGEIGHPFRDVCETVEFLINFLNGKPSEDEFCFYYCIGKA